VACLFVGCCLVVLVSGIILVTVAPVPLLSKRDSGERLRKQLGSITGPDSAIMKTHENAAIEKIVFMCVCMYVCMYVCMHACMYV